LHDWHRDTGRKAAPGRSVTGAMPVTVEIGDETGRDLMADGKPSLRRSEMKIVREDRHTK